MLLSAHRPENHKGVVPFQIHSKEEESVCLIAIVTEGSQEELCYLHSLQKRFEAQYGKKLIIHYLNDLIDTAICKVETQASHPLRRLKLMDEYISLHNPDFKRYPDEAWIVCDRDDQSFKSDQYDEVMRYCSSHSVRFVVSNPSFQLWLLFHHDSWLRETLYEDGLTSPERLSLIERRLKCIYPFYRHGSLNFSHFASLVEDAVLHSSAYCADIKKLKFEVGTNFAQLVVSLKNRYEG